MVDIKNTHLTKKQFAVLKMRIAGKSLSKIARELNTSRANVSSIAKTAEENIKKSRNTLKLIEMIDWPIKIGVKAGDSIYEISEKVFHEADLKKIKIFNDYPEIVRIITKFLGTSGLRRRKVLKDFTIFISGDGKVDVF